MFTAEQWARLVDAIEGQTSHTGDLDAALLLPDVLNSDAIWLLNRCFGLRGSMSWGQMASALVAVDVLAGSAAPMIDIVWTGPANGVFPVRRLDQVLYDLISQSTRRIMIVTFAAHRVAHLCQHLAAALDRGVALTLVLEGEEESGGQLTYDALHAFKSLAGRDIEAYCWPLERRERNNAGRPGKLHAKCAVVDSTAVVGSGNLTDDAFNRNMELGLVVQDRIMADTIYDHFIALIKRQELRRIALH